MRAGDRMVVTRVNSPSEEGTFFEAHFTTKENGRRLVPVEGMRVEFCNGKRTGLKAAFHELGSLKPEQGELLSFGELQDGEILQIHRDATVQECSMPYEGWDLYGRILGTLFTSEAVNWSTFDEFPLDRFAELSKQRRQFYEQILPQAVGNMYLVMQRMHRYCHFDTAKKMHHFLVMLASKNFGDVRDHHIICDIFADLAPDMLVIPRYTK